MLKEEQAKKEAEWKSEQEHHEQTLYILRAQIDETEHQKAVAKKKKGDAYDSDEDDREGRALQYQAER